MTDEVIRWAGNLLIPATIAGFWILWRGQWVIMQLVKDIKLETELILQMHQTPDQYGIGTSALAGSMQDLARAIEANTHYMKWLGRHTTGKEPPPPVKGHR